MSDNGNPRKYNGQLTDSNGNGFGTWKQVIDWVEKQLFFKGAIRFLFTDENGRVLWDYFDIKYQNAMTYFDEQGVNDNYRQNALLLRALLARIDAENGISERFWFCNGDDFWRNSVLLNNNLTSVVSNILQNLIKRDNAILQNTKAWIADDTLLADAIRYDDIYGQWHIVGDWFGGIGANRLKYDDRYSITMRPQNEQNEHYYTLTRYCYRTTGNVRYPNQIIPLCNLLRNKLLEQFDSPQKRGTCYFIGWTSDIEFMHNNFWFRWKGMPSTGESDIYLLKNDWKNQTDQYEHPNDNPQEYYCFDVEAGETPESFLSKLNDLIRR